MLSNNSRKIHTILPATIASNSLLSKPVACSSSVGIVSARGAAEMQNNKVFNLIEFVLKGNNDRSEYQWWLALFGIMGNAPPHQKINKKTVQLTYNN